MRRLPPFLFGVGLGAFVDGIVLHQILQWHHMLSAEHAPSTRDGLSLNVVADGFFHVGAFVLVALAALLTYREWNRGTRALSWMEQTGLLMVGWGAFNLVEGLVNHHLLQVHHVRDDLGGPLAWDLGFLAVSALLVLLGGALAVTGSRRRARRDPAPDARVVPASRR